jgi:hypothetical protein
VWEKGAPRILEDVTIGRGWGGEKKGVGGLCVSKTTQKRAAGDTRLMLRLPKLRVQTSCHFSNTVHTYLMYRTLNPSPFSGRKMSRKLRNIGKFGLIEIERTLGRKKTVKKKLTNFLSKMSAFNIFRYN